MLCVLTSHYTFSGDKDITFIPMNPDNQVVKLNQDTHEPPLFVVYCDECEFPYLSAIAKCLNGKTTIYALPSPQALNHGFRTVEGGAAHITAVLRSVLPRGPYRLLGWSFGGVFAYEVAAQLLGADEEVAFLGLLHVHYCGSAPSSRGFVDVLTNDRLFTTLFQRLVYLRQHWRVPEDTVESDVSDAAVLRLRGRWSEDASLKKHLGDLTDDDIYRRVKQLSIYARQFVQYHAPVLPIRMQLFLAEDLCTKDESLGWNQVVSIEQIDTTKVAGDQYSLLQSEYIGDLCTKIGNKLSAAAPMVSGGKHAHDPLLPIRSAKRRKSVVVCVPGAGAGVTTFVELAEHFGEELFVYGMQPRGLDNECGPHTTVQATAASYVDALIQVAAKEHINLLGHSYGGWVVFEMALQLQAKGISVQSIIILDSEAPDHTEVPIREYDDDEVLVEWIRALEYVLERPIEVDETAIANRTQEQQILMLHALMSKNKLMPPNSYPGDLVGPLRAFARALRDCYRPDRQYLEPVNVFLAENSYPSFYDEAHKERNARIVQRWRVWAPNLVAGVSPGNHVTMLRKRNAKELAGLIGSVINEPVQVSVTRGVSGC